ncbi:PREDICTED: uncharacterized protein LOC109464218 [Branchiostoma belcheri]|uniref:Uncharacterized protein LOC109464218 n=1 Tax=Branchiostoma belcheri TaxID=7741 RepID=A0A6P4YIA1_BRABE|nr:PREDICTED: uncharacterized protein LOC109464218 [Branchiostoma belcheri]XP_019616712.1 PREDICTED: uncharacterized protein LOC109464218 [Branchiostoma belcheri]XP_019616713.1 PREDICTED: uncharacterized protein LOC109464218 [Branchiostoma belcheri]
MGLLLQSPRLREGATPVLHSWTKVTPQRPAPKPRWCPPPKKPKGPQKLNKIVVSEPDIAMDTSASGTSPDLDVSMDASGSGLDMDIDQSVPDFSEKTSEVDTVSKTTSIVTVSPPPVKVDVSTQTAWTPLSTSTQTTSDSDCNVQSVHDHVYTFVKDKSQTLESYKDYVLQLESKLQAVEEECKHLKKTVHSLKAQVNANTFCANAFRGDDDAMRFYTGLPSFDVFMALYEYIAPKAMQLQYWRGSSTVRDSKPHQRPGMCRPGPKKKCTLLDEFFLVLVRLKVGLFHKDLAIRFNLSESTVSRIVTTWINFLYLELPLMFPFPTQADIRANMPLQFSQYPTTRIIIDCTEIFIEVPSAMLAQSQTWSNYKHHNTWKALVGISPNGMVTFVSKLWGGRVSDKAITRDSGLLALLESGDNVMADRGFEISDILPPGVSLNIPPFKGDRAALSAAEVQETMDIASVRIHVERAIGRIKNYHILDGVMPITMAKQADQIFTVCAYLTNFSPPLVKKE